VDIVERIGARLRQSVGGIGLAGPAEPARRPSPTCGVELLEASLNVAA
jgi:hypothetical protein